VTYRCHIMCHIMWFVPNISYFTYSMAEFWRFYLEWPEQKAPRSRTLRSPCPRLGAAGSHRKSRVSEPERCYGAGSWSVWTHLKREGLRLHDSLQDHEPVRGHVDVAAVLDLVLQVWVRTLTPTQCHDINNELFSKSSWKTERIIG